MHFCAKLSWTDVKNAIKNLCRKKDTKEAEYFPVIHAYQTY